MPKPRRQYTCCCFVNNIRYLILLLLIACSSILFANVVLYSVAVMYDDLQHSQLWQQPQLSEFASTKKTRIPRDIVGDDDLDGLELSNHLMEMLNEDNFNENTTLSTMFAGHSNHTTTYKNVSHFDRDEAANFSNWDDNAKISNGEKSEEEGMRQTLKQRTKHFLVWTAPGAGMLCGSFPAFWFLRSFGGRRFFAISMILSATATALLAIVPHIKYGQYLTVCMRFVQGFAFASIFPVIGLVTANWGTLKQHWPLSAVMFTHDYRSPFLAHALLTCLVSLIWFLIFREKPQYHSLVNGLELNKIVAGKIKGRHNRVVGDNPLRLLFTSFPVWAVWIAGCGYFLVISLAVQFLPLYCFLIVHEAREDSPVMASIPFLFMLIFTVLYGLWRYLGKLCNQRTSVLAFNTTSFIICSLIFIFLAIFPPGGTLHCGIVTAFTSILCILTFSIHGFFQSATLVGRFFAQFIVSFMQFFIGVAFFFTAAAVVFFVEENNADEWRLIFLLIAALLLISAAVFGIFGSAAPEDWSKDSWDPSAARPMITFDQIDYHMEECGVLEMKILT
ncbi:unnamed protein product [Thelazia callipaeda]|uniref:MFS domain-containing protein n=1 Tax=Thelazia callipaeda TaxID=103827 RepID=A0A0N5CVA5_THECL|nr:unnamed protein product [Thelazia callipaeda]